MLVIHTKQEKTGISLNVMLKHLSETELCLKAFKVIRQKCMNWCHICYKNICIECLIIKLCIPFMPFHNSYGIMSLEYIRNTRLPGNMIINQCLTLKQTV